MRKIIIFIGRGHLCCWVVRSASPSSLYSQKPGADTKGRSSVKCRKKAGRFFPTATHAVGAWGIRNTPQLNRAVCVFSLLHKVSCLVMSSLSLPSLVPPPSRCPLPCYPIISLLPAPRRNLVVSPLSLSTPRPFSHSNTDNIPQATKNTIILNCAFLDYNI